MATFKSVVVTTKNHIKADGTTNIKIRIYHKKESQYVPTDYYIDPLLMGTEIVQVYSEKPAGAASYPVNQTKGIVLIVKGSSGWVRKAIAK